MERGKGITRKERRRGKEERSKGKALTFLK